ncbi:hypothetical protein PVW53_19760 [Seohaeicola sp. SP36]|uniref:hypothetical protein n=1 Tax=unclassified Seohaeicola TaxID=2641111 RepID=UPI00237A78E6|nr:MULTISPECIES: hypothetical protein [unclassified Seohaeicola]MDD9709502.1 hypothetical protein [Seohaeicola sp. 4SK31]MDD9737747.1 hypothetical protein [Seohaeicola sp. SP36]
MNEQPAELNSEDLIVRINQYAAECGMCPSELLEMIRSVIAASELKTTTGASNAELIRLIRDLGFRTRNAEEGPTFIMFHLRRHIDITADDLAAWKKSPAHFGTPNPFPKSSIEDEKDPEITRALLSQEGAVFAAPRLFSENVEIFAGSLWND